MKEKQTKMKHPELDENEMYELISTMPAIRNLTKYLARKNKSWLVPINSDNSKLATINAASFKKKGKTTYLLGVAFRE